MKKIKWGVLGTAGIARKQTIKGMLEADNCELYAIAGRSFAKAEAFQKEFGFQKAYGSYEALLEDPEIQAVYIPLPNHLHVEWVKKAAKAGKHILCEKPLALNEEELKEAFAVCKENQVLLMEAYAYLHSDVIKEMIKRIQDGEIGTIKMIESCFFTEEPKKEDIRWVKEYGGGSVYDLGCYCISLTERVLNEMPAEVRAMARFSKTGVDDFCQMYFGFPNDVIAALGCGFCATGRSDRMVFHGEKGSIFAEIEFNQEGICCFDIVKDGEKEHFERKVKSNYALEIEQFGRCISDGEAPYISEEFSTKVCRTINRVLKEIKY